MSVHGSRKPRSFDYSRVEGMLLGLAIGDSLGKTSESINPRERAAIFGEIRDYLPHPAIGEAKGLPSDDTQLAFWTLERLIEDGGFEPVRVAKAFTGRRIYGLGGSVGRFLRNMKSGVRWDYAAPKSAGNGALMRIAPILVPHLRTGGARLREDAATCARITHDDPASTSACVAFVQQLWQLLGMDRAPAPEWWVDSYVKVASEIEGETAYRTRSPHYPEFEGSLWSFVQSEVPRALEAGDSVLTAQDRWYSGAYLLETVPTVLMILALHAHDPEEAIVRAVNETRDNDTIAAIVGAAVRALHGREGLPHRWIDNLLGRTAEDDDGRVFELIEQARRKFWEDAE